VNLPLPGAIVRVDATIEDHHIDDCAVIEHVHTRHGELWVELLPWIERWSYGDSVIVRASAVQVIAGRPEVAR